MPTFFKPLGYFKPISAVGEIEPFTAQTVSVEFDGVDEIMANLAGQKIGCANTFSWSMWVKPRDDVFVARSRIFSMRNPAPVPAHSIFAVDMRGAETDDPLEVNIWDDGGSLIKTYRWSNLLTEDVWSFLTVTWDGPGGVGTGLILHHNGTQVAHDALPSADGAGTFVDSADNVIAIGSNIPPGTLESDCIIHSTALWNNILSNAEHTALYNGGSASTVDYNVDSGAYTSSNNLQHWWKLGHNASDMGKDYVDPSNPPSLIDVDRDRDNMSSANIVADYPGI